MELGQLSKNDFQTENKKSGLIIAPFEPIRINGASYDISPTIIAMSTKLGMLETVYREKTYPFKYYIYVKAKDTVLAVSREFISVPNYIAGYVVSRVSKVSEGFGHVSTSIDPNWKGALLIALSNPSNKPIKVYVGGSSVESETSNSLATISFHYLNTACDDIARVHAGMRLDLLKKVNYTQRTGVRATLSKILHPNRKRFTDFFFNYCSNSILDLENWENIVNDLQGSTTQPECFYCKTYIDGSKKKKIKFVDFIVSEHFIFRFVHWFQKHGATIYRIITIIFALLVVCGLLPIEWKDKIKEFFESVNMFS